MTRLTLLGVPFTAPSGTIISGAMIEGSDSMDGYAISGHDGRAEMIEEHDGMESSVLLEFIGDSVTKERGDSMQAGAVAVFPLDTHLIIQEFDYTVNVQQALLWQYNEAVNLQAIVKNKQAWYDSNQTQFWENWYRDVFNLQTANIFGLSVWSIILGQPIVFNNAANPGQIPWGFGTNNVDFTQGNFAGGAGGSYALPLSAARILLQLRAFQLVSSGTVPEINRMLAYVFKNYGPAWLIDNHDMTQTYMFDFTLTADLIYIFNNIDILPRPAGVSSTYVEV